MPNISNPEAFQYEAAVILAGAYGAFPMPSAWTHDADNEFYPTDTGQSRRDVQFHTISWLVAHDYLGDEGGMIGGQWRGLRLTERGLSVLNTVPDVLSGKEPLGKRLVVAVAKGSVSVIRQTHSDDHPASDRRRMSIRPETPNQAMQRTAGRSAFWFSMTSTFNLQPRAPSPAVADLVSR